MKAIIDGKRYDTETATHVANGGPAGLGRSDFRWYDEDLYRTPRGNWFLAGEGGPMTRYARSCGDNTTTGGEAITPLTPDEALQWLENEGETEAIEQYFSESVQDA